MNIVSPIKGKCSLGEYGRGSCELAFGPKVNR
jgi:hypothetical protein